MTKYKNKKTIVDGISFDSILESRYYDVLYKSKELGHIKDFELQPIFILQDKFKRDGKAIRAIKYKADFKIINHDGSYEIIDIKGSKEMLKSDFKIKWKMLQYKFPEVNCKCITHDKKMGWYEIM